MGARPNLSEWTLIDFRLTINKLNAIQLCLNWCKLLQSLILYRDGFILAKNALFLNEYTTVSFFRFTIYFYPLSAQHFKLIFATSIWSNHFPLCRLCYDLLIYLFLYHIVTLLFINYYRQPIYSLSVL